MTSNGPSALRAAGPLARALALVLDEFVRWLLITAVTVALLTSGRFSVAACVATMFSVYWLYGASFEAFAGGQTPGKRALRLRVVTRDGNPVGFAAASIRNIALLLDALPFAYVLGLLVMMTTQRFRRIGDVAARTVVVYADDVVEPWAEVDRGCEAVRRTPALYYGAWAATAAPIFAVLAIAFWDSPSFAAVAIWWFKPLYERIPLWIYAQRVRSEPASIALASTQWRALARGLGSMLTYRRLVPRRSYEAPIEALEGLRGAQRRGRAMVLNRSEAQPAVWATIVGVHVEAFVSTIGGFALWYAMPAARFDIESLLAIAEDPWFGWASNVIYLGAIALVGPMYAAGGCALYLHRLDTLGHDRV